MNDCGYPNCAECSLPDCNMSSKDVAALLKRRRYHKDINTARAKQNAYRELRRRQLPQCSECESCVLVENVKHDGHMRLCVIQMRLIEQKVSNSPRWCVKRKNYREVGVEQNE